MEEDRKPLFLVEGSVRFRDPLPDNILSSVKQEARLDTQREGNEQGG